MITKPDKNAARIGRHQRVRRRISGSALRPRLCVYRSNTNIYCQIIDDEAGHTLASASTMEPDVREQIKGMTKTEAATFIGKRIGQKALAVDVKTVVFDRGGYLYTGRVAEIARGAREAGLEF